MELIRERPIVREATYITEWPKVPPCSFEVNEIADKKRKTQRRSDRADSIHEAKEQSTEYIGAVEENVNLKPQLPEIEDQDPATENQDPAAVAVEPLKEQQPEQRWLGLRRFSLQKSPWPSPHLSIGAKCSRMGSMECWEAIGPAQELFKQISQSVGDLLDERVEEIEEGEPVAGHILTFGLYMIGKEIGAARPTLIFTCQRPKPRRRAIKFIKESEILKGYPKIALAESSAVPMAQGRNYLRLLATYGTPSLNSGPVSSTGVIGSTASQGLGGIIMRVGGFATSIATRSNTPNHGGPKTYLIVAIVCGILLFLVVFGVAVYLCGRQRTLRQLLRPSALPTSAPHLSFDPSRMAQTESSGSPKLYTGEFPGPFLPHSMPLYQPPSNHQGKKVPVPSSEMSSVMPFGEDSRIPIFAESLQVYEVCNSNIPTELALAREAVVDSHLEECTSIYGMQIMSVETKKLATIGGIVLSKGKYYGLTVAHVFANACNMAPAKHSMEDEGSDQEFAFDSEYEEERDENGLPDVAITSQASISSVSRTISASSASINVGTDPSAISIYAKQIPEFMDERNSCIIGSGTQSLPNPGQSIRSASKTHLNHDWALIELSKQSVLQAQAACSEDPLLEGVILPTRFKSNPTNNAEVLVIKRRSGMSKGIISSSTTMMKLQPRGAFQEVWTVRLNEDSCLVEGDSGSWVIDAATGDLYGHVVAGVTEAGLAYIVPAYKTFEDIEKCVGPFEFLTKDTSN